MRDDAVTPELHELVLKRDRVCFLARRDAHHECRDRFGRHLSTDLRRLTVDHVHEGYGKMGKRAPSDKEHLVALCWNVNVNGPGRTSSWTMTMLREAERAYLKELYPDDDP